MNQPLLKYIFGFCIATFLWACSDDTRQSTRIPPLPAFNSKNRIQKSIEFLSKAIKRNSRSATAYYKRAELYAEIRQWTEALEDINKALDISPNRGIFLISRARVLRQLRQYDKALIDARRAEGLKESLPGLYTILGDLMQQKRQLKQADLYLNRALQMSPFDGEAYFYKGTLLAKQGDTTTAITLIEQGLALKPRFMPPYNELTNIYTYLGDFGRALYYNNLGIKYFPYEAPLQFARGQLYRRKLRLDSALIFYVNASKLDTTHNLADFQAGVIYFRWKNYGKAASHLGRVARQNPKFRDIHFLLGIAFDKIGNVNKAIENYQQSIANDPKNYKVYGLLNQAQKRQQFFDTYGYWPRALARTDSSQGVAPIGSVPAPVAETKTLDSSRIKIEAIAPRLQIRTKSAADTVKNLRIRQ